MSDSNHESDGPGRPISVARRPSRQRQLQIELARRAEEIHVQADPVLAAIRSRDPRRVLEQACIATAEEAAAVRWERLMRPFDREAPKMASRHVTLLAEAARLVLALERLEPGLPSPGVTANIFRAFWATVRETAAEVLSAAEVELLMTKCAKRVASRGLGEFEGLLVDDDVLAGAP
jgi:hypothetical protein